MIDPIRIQEIFQAICLHLNSDSYNFFLYRGKTRSKKLTPFASRIATRLKTEEEVIGFFIANQIEYFLEHNKINTWIGNFTNREAFDIWEVHTGYLDTRNYKMKSELKILLQLGKDVKNFQVIYPLLTSRKVSFSTLGNMMLHMDMKTVWMTDDPLLSETLLFAWRISDFFIIPKENFRKAILEVRSEL